MPGGLLPIKIPPGMWANGSQLEAGGRWYWGNLVRWADGVMRPIGGWSALITGGGALTGIARGGIAWQDNGGFNNVAIGTTQKLYWGTGGVFSDVTPADFTTGNTDSILGSGYGAGNYGVGNYGEPSTSGNPLELAASTWSFANWGGDVVCCMTGDNVLYEINTSNGSVSAIAGAPTAYAVMSTNEDFLVAIGAGNVGRALEWCSVGNDSIWTPASTNSAGGINMNTGGRGLAGRVVGIQNLIWTTTDVQLLNFVGNPGIYGPVKLADGCGLIAPNAVVVTDVAYWWSWGGFFKYNGVVQPMRCDVQDYLWRNVNWLQAQKIYGATNTAWNEIIWFFPSLNSTECDSYVIYNYKYDIWYFGMQSGLARTTWIDQGVFPWPLGVDAAGIVYEQEQGYLANGASRAGQVWCESGPAQVGNGDRIIYSNLMLPDASINPSSLELSAWTKFTPQGPQSSFGPWSLVGNSEGYVGMQFVGRQCALLVDQVADTDWSLGLIRFNSVGGGRR
jgi:hypothetical protein